MNINIFRGNCAHHLLANPTQLQYLGDNPFHQAQLYEQVQSLGRMGRDQQFIHFIADTFATDLLKFSSLAYNRTPCLWLDSKIELSGEAHGTQQAERVFIETLIWLVANGPQNMLLKVLPSSKKVDDVPVERITCHSIDGKIP